MADTVTDGDKAGEAPSNKGADGAESSANPESSSQRQFNPLGDLSSYTYKLTLYMIDPDGYSAWVAGDNSVVKNFKILAQSGGVNEAAGDTRAPGFNLDYYIDNLHITTLTPSRTGIPSNSYKFKFQIFEPYGFTFTTKLVEAAKNMQAGAAANQKADVTVTALRQHYMLMIRFYGYDASGKPVTGSDYAYSDSNRVDQNSIFERAFPMVLTKFNFKLDNKTVVYNLEGTLINEQLGASVKRGIIKDQITLKADTVEAALKGDTNNKKITGLMQVLNVQQDKFLNDKLISIKDEYEIEFSSPEIAKATVVDPEYYNKVKAGTVAIESLAKVNVKTAESADAKVVEKGIREISLTPGMSIIHAIDQVVSQSSYISDAMLSNDKEMIAPVNKDDKQYTTKDDPKKLMWFNVTPVITKNLGFDKLRNDFAYRIKYLVQQYEIPYVRALYVKNTTAYPGAHKRYDYWYTGKNTEILSYDQNYNLLYFTNIAMGSKAPKPEDSTSSSTPASPQGGQNADNTNMASGAATQIANLKTFLYSPVDQLGARITILGDPDYLMPVTAQSVDKLLKKRYGENFTINPNSGQVFIEIFFRQTEDYDNTDGLMKPNGNIQFYDYPDSLKTKIKGMAYMLLEVTSIFAHGKFTQELKTVLPPLKTLAQSADQAKADSSGAGRSATGTSGSETLTPTVVDSAGVKAPSTREPTQSSSGGANGGTGTDAGQAAGNAMTSSNYGTRADTSLAGTASSATKTTPTNNGTQTADDDGSYDRSELQRMQNRVASNAAGREPAAGLPGWNGSASLAGTFAKIAPTLDPKTLLPKR